MDAGQEPWLYDADKKIKISCHKKQSMNEKGHMLMQDACRLASEAGVKELWLTHYSPAEKHPENFEKELKKLFPNVLISKDGEKKTL